MSEFDVIVVGAGPAGASAAIKLATSGSSVLLVERGDPPGSKNVSGGVLWGDSMGSVIPDWEKTAPMERYVEAKGVSFLKLGVKKIVNVEIDGQVVEVSRKFFPELYSSFSNPSVELLIDDGIKFMKKNKGTFDLIVVDSTDPVGPAEGLFNIDFYKDAKGALKDDGLIVTQSGSPFYQPKGLSLAASGMKSVFKNIKVYTAFIPTYPSGFWSFTMGSDAEIKPYFHNVSPGKYFNKGILDGASLLPEFVKELI